ncbi:hypothetical protein [Paenibacillus sp. Y412MC10]|nr:hypothetical protein [Paenibacillus sp. Y412MC10]
MVKWLEVDEGWGFLEREQGMGVNIRGVIIGRRGEVGVVVEGK